MVLFNGDGEWLANAILNYDLTLENIVDTLSHKANTLNNRAFQTILKNRCYHGGIMAEGAGLLKYGESGKGINSRWYPETLAKRIYDITSYHEKLIFRQEDAFKTLGLLRYQKDTAFFIDPPYNLMLHVK